MQITEMESSAASGRGSVGSANLAELREDGYGAAADAGRRQTASALELQFVELKSTSGG